MAIETRPATAEDAPFLAWVMQEAARSHLEKGIWDIAFPGEDEPRLEILAKVLTTERVHFGHYSLFRILEFDSQPASALCAYEPSEHGIEQLRLGMAEAFSQLGWSPEEMLAVGERVGSFAATGYPNPDGLWIVEWVATRPEFRGRALVRRLLLEILEEGRAKGFECAQIGYLLGNFRAKSAYEGVGFKWVDEHCHPDFEADYGTPGVARMQRDL
jgi:ribosomal protein S18 acetylase RimI-like enzyme